MNDEKVPVHHPELDGAWHFRIWKQRRKRRDLSSYILSYIYLSKIVVTFQKKIGPG